MARIIEVPNYGLVEFPDGMTDDQIVAAIKKTAMDYPKKRAIPSNAAVAGNSVLKGLAGIPDAILNTPGNLWNLAKAGVGTAATAAGRVDLAPEVDAVPWSPVEGALRKFGVIRAEADPQTAGQRILDMTVQGLTGGVVSPASGVRQVLANAGIGLVGGMTGGVAGELSGNNPLATVAGGVTGAWAASRGAKSGVHAGRQIAAGQQGKTGKILAAASDVSPEELARRIRAGDVEILPGSRPTTTQAAMTPGISQLQRSAHSAGADFSGVTAKQNEARRAAIEGVAPGASGLKAHEAAQIAGEDIARSWRSQRAKFREAERGAWQNPAMDDLSFTLPANKIRSAIEQYYPGQTYGEAPALLRRIAEADGVLSHQEMQKIRSLVGEMSRDLRNTDPSGRAASLAVKKAISDLYDESQAAGAHKFAVTGQGPHGPVYGNLAGDPENAVAHLLRTRTGEVPGAVTHPFAGGVDLVAGNDKAGVLHIAQQGRDEALNALPGLMREGTWYSRPSSGAGRTYLGDGSREAAVRMDWDGQAKQWVPTAYDQYPTRGVTPETGSTTNLAGFTKSQNSALQRGDIASIDDILSQMLAESRAGNAPAHPPATPRDPRAYSPNLMAPDQAGWLDMARRLTQQRKAQLETGPARDIGQIGTDGLPKRQGAEVFNAFYGPRTSQTQDMAGLRTLLSADDNTLGAARRAAMSDMLERAGNQGGLLSDAALGRYMDARQGALRGLFDGDQFDTLGKVRADLRRATEADSLNRVTGSDTAQKLLGSGLLDSPVLGWTASVVPKVGPAALEWLRAYERTKNARAVGQALIDPDIALAALERHQRTLAPTAFDRGVPAFMLPGLLNFTQPPQ